MLTCPNFSPCKIIVLGDAMLDRYWHGDTSRISPEAPVPVVRIEKNEERVGGAANVAVNVQALGASTTLIAAVGKDDAGERLSAMLQEKKVECKFVYSPSASTTLKLRVLGRHQQLIRLDFEDKQRWSAATMIEKLEPIISDAHVIILSDYAKGVISEPQAIIGYARAKGIKVLVDPKNPDLSVYRGATMLTPNLGEFEAAVGHCENEAEIERKGLALVKELDLEGLLVTRGSQGMTLIARDEKPVHIPAQAREVFDITGAGDTVIAVLGACLGVGTSLLQAAKLANTAAAISVGRLGTATITYQELQDALTNEMIGAGAQGICSLQALLPELARRTERGEKIVMTNGCFDILHAGHVTYLQQARAKGDCLVVAVNDDDSVKRLKGSSRPINPLAERMQVLAALACVDYVVSFAEDTPQALIAQILPHILVKGGDYTVEQIAGAKEVIQHGGKVEILSFVDGCSTTNMLNQLLKSMKQDEKSLEVVE
ncbi:MAG: bifunctional D-glycero-beta-D-manno-heptose-7-phosphate kinase/D-glycero-beta-D-manno-heptose 1-phosphate adenylyltransferase HldE [Gammaproteobacteria bacterium]|nr:bifunctional D-glycero-beta-D-manno-heptose-7-phosphate kinase/D-glycero-beta-D-manno-heptose 1-phosphate adenylyltransferase HldE [Gammaproteobacteria bacterium]